MKKVLITGIYGQDGSYLAEQLFDEGYEIYGICRKQLSRNSCRIKEELNKQGILINEYNQSLHDYKEISNLLKQIQPDILFHMAATHRSSGNKNNSNIYSEKELFDLNVLATNNILTACYENVKNCKVITAGSCLVFDDSKTDLQDEMTKFETSSMYGLAKSTEAEIVGFYRKKGLFACSPILYNHESHRRSDDFVTKKIAVGLKKIKEGKMENLVLGDITVKKDWGHAKDYADAMICVAKGSVPRNYIISSGELHSIKEYIEICAEKIGLTDWERYVKIDTSILTRKNNTVLKGNSLLIEKEIGWKRTISFEQMVDEIVKNL